MLSAVKLSSLAFLQAQGLQSLCSGTVPLGTMLLMMDLVAAMGCRRVWEMIQPVFVYEPWFVPWF